MQFQEKVVHEKFSLMIAYPCIEVPYVYVMKGTTVVGHLAKLWFHLCSKVEVDSSPSVVTLKFVACNTINVKNSLIRYGFLLTMAIHTFLLGL